MKGLFFRARTRALSSRSAGTAGTAFGAKQALLPFIKLIHPDMFALAAPQVKVANLRCVQTVYELWEALGHVEQSSAGKDFTLPKPLRPAYELTCYVRGGEGAEPQRVVFTLQTPPALTRWLGRGRHPKAQAAKLRGAHPKPRGSCSAGRGQGSSRSWRRRRRSGVEQGGRGPAEACSRARSRSGGGARRPCRGPAPRG